MQEVLEYVSDFDEAKGAINSRITGCVLETRMEPELVWQLGLYEVKPVSALAAEILTG